MVARIVHGHGGTVEAGNNPAGGAEFILRLPLAETVPAVQRRVRDLPRDRGSGRALRASSTAAGRR